MKILAALTLSLGIGVNIAAFQIVDAVFWKPPEVPDPQSIVRLFRGRVGAFPNPAVPLAADNTVFSAVLVRSDSETPFQTVSISIAIWCG